MTERARSLSLAGLVAVAVAVYCSGVRGDLPLAPDVDEPAFVDRAVLMASEHTWDPHWFGHPGSTMILPLTIVFRLLHPDAGAMAAHPSLYYLVARSLSIAYAAFSLVLLFLLARRLFDATTGLIAVALLIPLPTVVLMVRLGRTDGASLFFGTLVVYASVRASENPSTRNHLWVGAALGAAIATKWYFAVFGWAPFFVVVRELWRSRRDSRAVVVAVGRGLLALVVTCLVFLAFTPSALVNASTIQNDFADEAHPGPWFQRAPSFASALAAYLGEILPGMLGWVQTTLLGLGALLTLRRPSARTALTTLVVAIFVLSISSLSLSIERWMCAIAPLLCVLIAYAIVTLTRGRVWAAWLVTLVVAAPMAWETGIQVRRSWSSSRREARQWVHDHVPVDSRLIWEIDGARWMTPNLSWGGRDPSPSLIGGARYYIHSEVSASESRGLDAFRCEGYQYLIVNHSRVRKRLRAKVPAETLFQGRLDQETRLIAEFVGWGDSYFPAIRIYDISGIRCPG